jgi:methionine transaminase
MLSPITSKLPNVGTTIFSVMSALAQEYQAINLSQGFPNFECSLRLQALIYEYMKQGFNQYAPMPGLPVLRERLAEKINRLYGATIEANHITITAGGTQALFTAITAFVHSGDEVIIIEPAYDSYRPAIELCGGIPVIYELKAPNYAIDWAAFEQLISPRTRMIIFNTPHNPTATIWTENDLLQLQKVTANTDILILSDEVYEHLIYDNALHQSVMRYPALWERSMAVYSFGKTFHATGWKIGYLVAPPHLTTEFRKVHQFNVFSVNTPIQYAIAEFLDTPDEYLSLPKFYQDKRDFFLAEAQNIPFKLLPCNGTYFQLLDYSEISQEPDVDFAKRLTKMYGVATIPVSAFYSSQRDDKIIRICFAKTETTLSKAARLLEQIK